jgi:5-methyltetrahydrofolate corrinoid/iron sulfur protein methyltransferase
MLIIAENINSSRKKIKPILENKDTAALKELVDKLDATDCDYIDINAGVFVNQETELMLWLAEEVQKLTDKPLSIDSPSIDVIKAVITHCDKKAFLNSITIEKERYEKTIPVVLEHKPNVIALSIDDEGIP